MKRTINLNQYFQMGGILKNLDVRNCMTNAGDSNMGMDIHSFQFRAKNAMTYWVSVTFVSGIVKDYPGNEISVSVDMVLDEKYK